MAFKSQVQRNGKPGEKRHAKKREALVDAAGTVGKMGWESSVEGGGCTRTHITSKGDHLKHWMCARQKGKLYHSGRLKGRGRGSRKQDVLQNILVMPHH